MPEEHIHLSGADVGRRLLENAGFTVDLHDRCTGCEEVSIRPVVGLVDAVLRNRLTGAVLALPAARDGIEARHNEGRPFPVRPSGPVTTAFGTIT